MKNKMCESWILLKIKLFNIIIETNKQKRLRFDKYQGVNKIRRKFTYGIIKRNSKVWKN